MLPALDTDGLDRKAAAYNRGVADEVRHSIGARLSPPISFKRDRVGIRLRSALAIWQLRLCKYPGMDYGIGNRLPVPDSSAETTIQRQGRRLQRRRSEDEYSRYFQ